MYFLDGYVPCYSKRFKTVKHGLGIGQWKEDGTLFKFRNRFVPANGGGFALIKPPCKKSGIIFGGPDGLESEEAWTSHLKEICEEVASALSIEAVIVKRDNASAGEFLRPPDHLMTSRELNGCLPGRSEEGLQLLCTHVQIRTSIERVLEILFPSSWSEETKLSARFTAGSAPIHHGSDPIHDLIIGQLKNAHVLISRAPWKWQVKEEVSDIIFRKVAKAGMSSPCIGTYWTIFWLT